MADKSDDKRQTASSKRDRSDALVEAGSRFCRDLRNSGNPDRGRPADKGFRDSLYDDGFAPAPELPEQG